MHTLKVPARARRPATRRPPHPSRAPAAPGRRRPSGAALSPRGRAGTALRGLSCCARARRGEGRASRRRWRRRRPRCVGASLGLRVLKDWTTVRVTRAALGPRRAIKMDRFHYRVTLTGATLTSCPASHSTLLPLSPPPPRPHPHPMNDPPKEAESPPPPPPHPMNDPPKEAEALSMAPYVKQDTRGKETVYNRVGDPCKQSIQAILMAALVALTSARPLTMILGSFSADWARRFGSAHL